MLSVDGKRERLMKSETAWRTRLKGTRAK